MTGPSITNEGPVFYFCFLPARAYLFPYLVIPQSANPDWILQRFFANPRAQWDHGFHDRSPPGRVYPDLATELRQSFSHPAQTDAGRGTSVKKRQNLRRNASSIIRNCQGDVSIARENSNTHRLGCRVTVHIGERFLQNTKQCDLDLSGQAFNRLDY